MQRARGVLGHSKRIVDQVCAKITLADAAARERRRQDEVPRSLPLMDFLVVSWPEDVFADFTPTIVVSNASDDCAGANSAVGRNVVILFVNRPFKFAVKARQHVSCSTVWITGFVRWNVVYCHMQWASSNCVSHQVYFLLALLGFTHSFLVFSARVVLRANDFSLW